MAVLPQICDMLKHQTESLRHLLHVLLLSLIYSSLRHNRTPYLHSMTSPPFLLSFPLLHRQLLLHWGDPGAQRIDFILYMRPIKHD